MFEQLNVTNSDSSEIDSKDPDLNTFKITGHNILVKPISVMSKTKGGIILSDQTLHDASYLMNVCKVLAIGPTAYTQEMFEGTGPWCKVGDFVLIPKIAGQKIKFKGVPLTLIACDKVLAVIEDPKDFDTTFNLGVGT